MKRLLKINPKSNRSCLACGLFLNQLPLEDNKPHADIFWVGLSAVRQEEGTQDVPLSSETKTGQLIAEIEERCKDRLTFYKTNAVKCLPLKKSKIRYPSKSEMKDCYPNLELELEVLNPKIVFLLGKQVSDFVLSQNGFRVANFDPDFDYLPQLIGDTVFIPIHHPSYILVYKRKWVDKYVRSICRLISKELVFNKKVA